MSADSEALGEMFDRSSAGLTSAARSITSNGARSLDEQRAKFVTQEHSAGGAITSAIDEGLAGTPRGSRRPRAT